MTLHSTPSPARNRTEAVAGPTALRRSSRRVPPLGGLCAPFLALELRRMLRNRRTAVLTLVMPSVLFLLFGTGHGSASAPAGSGNVTAYVLVSMAVYAAMLASTSAGASVAVERAAGWSRQLRLTPLRPAAYVIGKLLVAIVLAGGAVLVAYAAGVLTGARMPGHVWVETAVLGWTCSLVFAAFGLFLGYLLPSENVMQLLGPVLAVLAFTGGLFVPVDQMGSTFAALARFSPTYGVAQIARYPLVHDGEPGIALASVVLWTAVFAAGAAWRFRRDTARA